MFVKKQQLGRHTGTQRFCGSDQGHPGIMSLWTRLRDRVPD